MLINKLLVVKQNITVTICFNVASFQGIMFKLMKLQNRKFSVYWTHIILHELITTFRNNETFLTFYITYISHFILNITEFIRFKKVYHGRFKDSMLIRKVKNTFLQAIPFLTVISKHLNNFKSNQRILSCKNECLNNVFGNKLFDVIVTFPIAAKDIPFRKV